MTYGQLEALLNKIDKYEKVLDEIREYIENPRHEMSVKTYQNLSELLDKGKLK